MTRRVWHTGPPPHVGWWNARRVDNPSNDLWGWWNGLGWSSFADNYCTAKEAADCAKCRGAVYNGHGVEWTDYWPENARVPRVKP